MKPQKLAVVGLGYVGLPLAHIFAKKGYDVVGYDISAKRIEELSAGHDRTREIDDADLKSVTIMFTTDPATLEDREVIILAIPTPVDAKNKPDLTLVEKATEVVGKHLKKGMIVVYESTVYPGVTEELCGKILEKESGLVCGKDFTLGYSPERVNPGDKLHTIDKIIKVVAGQDEQTTDTLVELYGSIVTAGIHRASSIKVAEMAKAIENAQRDLNIAYMNEVAMLCNRIGIPTKDVLAAAGTKWNFLKYQPGLVGGHCIGVDPYYLVEKATRLGMNTQVINAGRATNDGMGPYVAEQIRKWLPKPGKDVTILVLGLTFKEDVPDTRNSKATDVVKHFEKLGYTVESHDPFVSPGPIPQGPFDAIAFLVPHKEYLSAGVDGMLKVLKSEGVLFDLKSLLDPAKVTQAGRKYLAL